MRRLIRASVIVSSSLMLLLSGCDGCGGCGGEKGASSAAASIDFPKTPEDATRELLARMPANAEWLGVVADPASITKGYGGLRPKLAAALQPFRVFDADIQNTLKLDLGSLAAGDKYGVEPSGGLGVAQTLDGGIVVLWVKDSEKFFGTIDEVITVQPYNYVLDPKPVTAGGLSFKKYARAADKATLYLNVDKGVARIIRVDGEPALADATLSRMVDPAAPRAETRAEIIRAASSMAGVPAWAWLPVDVVAPPDAGGGQAKLREALGPKGMFAVGLSPSTAELGLRFMALPDESAANPKMFLPPRNTVAPAFAALRTEDSYAYLRVTMELAEVFATLRGAANADQQAEITGALAKADELAGMSVEKDLLPSFGQAGVLLTTRARILSLSSAKNPPDYVRALGVVGAWQVKDRAKLKSALEKIAPALTGHATLFEEKGATVLQFTDPAWDMGNLVLTDGLLVLVPDEKRGELLDVLAAPAKDEGSGVAASLLRDPATNGLFIDVGKIMAGPIGSVFAPRLPEQAQTVLALISGVGIRARYADKAVGIDVSIGLNDGAVPAVAAPEPAAPPAPEGSAGSGATVKP